MEENNNSGSESDSNTVDDYYEPISAVDLDGEDEEDNHRPINGLSNGHCLISETEERVSSIDINGHVDESEEEEEDTETVTAEAETRTAFEEDERRRRTPLVAENAARVMEAMRAISFPGNVPDWADEDRWVDQLQRLRSSTTTTSQN